jgi:hypothetical protein
MTVNDNPFWEFYQEPLLQLTVNESSSSCDKVNNYELHPFLYGFNVFFCFWAGDVAVQ